MKFLLNMNLPRELGRRLGQHGYSWRHVGDIGMGRANDTDVVAEALRTQEVILTHDLDYGNLLAFSGQSEPSAVIFRLRNTHVDNLFERQMRAWPQIETPLAEGAIVIIEDGAVRIRRLPIRDETGTQV